MKTRIQICLEIVEATLFFSNSELAIAMLLTEKKKLEVEEQRLRNEVLTEAILKMIN